MGARNFSNYVERPDAAAAFREARDAALHEYGHRGYTGTIAEKREYVVLRERPMTLEQARAFARADDPDDKWGPARAIAIVKAEGGDVVGWYFYGLASE